MKEINLSEISDRDLHREQRRRNQLRKKRSRKAHGLPKRKKGMGCRIGDRDFAAMETRGFLDPGSYIRRDGSEKLVGRDWDARVVELINRASERCEMSTILGRLHDLSCLGWGAEPHHVIRRSVRRDDRLGNLALLSHSCHYSLDPRKIRSGKAGA